MQPMLPGYAATELLGWHVRRKSSQAKTLPPLCVGCGSLSFPARTLLLIIVPMLVLARTGLVSPAILDSATTIDPTVALWGTRMTTGHMVSSWMTWMVCVAARFTWSLDSSSFSTWASISWENPSMSWSPGGSRIGEAAICTSPEVGRAAIALALHSVVMADIAGNRFLWASFYMLNSRFNWSMCMAKLVGSGPCYVMRVSTVIMFMSMLMSWVIGRFLMVTISIALMGIQHSHWWVQDGCIDFVQWHWCVIRLGQVWQNLGIQNWQCMASMCIMFMLTSG